MGVLLRYRKLKSGKKSYYLDINHDGRRWREFLQARIKDQVKAKDANKPSEILALCKAIRNQRERELLTEGYEIEDLKKAKASFTAFFAQYAEGYAKADNRKIKAAYKHFKKHLGEISAKQLNYERCLSFAEHLQTNLKGETPSSYFGAFRKVVNLALRKGVLRKDPTIGIHVKKKSDRLVKQVLTVEELRKMHNTICGNTEVKRAFLFCCNTGLGLAELRTLTWSRINNNKLSHFSRAKTNTALSIDLNESAHYYMGPKGNKNDLVFKLPSATACNKVIKTWVKRAEIEKHITFYCARHTFACNLLIHGANAKTVSNLLGHKDLKHTNKYLNHVEELNKKAVAAIPSIHATRLVKVS